MHGLELKDVEGAQGVVQVTARMMVAISAAAVAAGQSAAVEERRVKWRVICEHPPPLVAVSIQTLQWRYRCHLGSPTLAQEEMALWGQSPDERERSRGWPWRCSALLWGCWPNVSP